MTAPSPRSAAERRLAEARDEGGPLTADDVRQQQIDLEREYAALIAGHPSIGMTQAEVLEAAEYDLGDLRASARELFPDHFGGGTADA